MSLTYYGVPSLQILEAGLHKLWVTSGQTRNSPGPPIPELQSQPILSVAAVVTLQWSPACSLGGPPFPSILCAREQSHPRFWEGEGKGGKDRADKYTLASPNSPSEKVNYIPAECAYARQSFSTLRHRLTPPGVFPSWLQVLILALSLTSPDSQLSLPIGIFSFYVSLGVVHWGLFVGSFPEYRKKYEVFLPRFLQHLTLLDKSTNW